MQIIENEFFSIEINEEHGGMISSIYDKTQHLEIIKRPSQDPWPNGGIPILFPFAGRNWHEEKIHTMEWNGQIYQMPIHGFLFSQPFSLQDKQQSCCTLKFTYSNQFKHIFPFKFDLLITYRLIHQKVEIIFDILNTCHQTMPLAPGLHPFFTITNNSDSTVELFSHKAFTVTSDGKSGSAIDIPLEKQNVSNQLVQNLIVKRLKTDSFASLRTASHCIKILPDHHFSYWVLWAQPHENSYCLEPWCGLPDVVKNKNGLIELSSQQRLQMQVHFEITSKNIKE